MFAPLERRFGGHVQVFLDRLRATWLRARGAHLGTATRVGGRCVIRRPWCLSTGERTQFEQQVHVKATADSARIVLGRDVFVGFNCEFDVSDSLWIGDQVLIAPGCFITDHQHKYGAQAPIVTQGCDVAPVRIEDDAWLGAHVTVLAGVTIGRGAIVGAGAVVTRDVAAMSIVAGVPARQIGTRN